MLVAFLLIFLSQIAILWWIQSGLQRIKIQNIEDVHEPLEGVSVIVAVKDEMPHITHNLQLLLSQDHPNFEVVVVVDHSSDDTWPAVKALENEYQNLRVLSLPKEQHGKKAAITFGIDQSRHELLAFTDGDCVPQHEDWLRKLTAPLLRDKDLVLGVGLSSVENTAWVGKLAAAEVSKIAGTYLAFAAHGMPYMGVGRSMAYTKSLFQRVNGFESHAQLRSGDDDLFVQAVKSQAKIGLAPDACTLSPPPSGFLQWFRQKQRHLKTAHRYGWRELLLLSALDGGAILMYAIGVYILVQSQGYTAIVVLMLLFRSLLVRSNMDQIHEWCDARSGRSALFLYEVMVALLIPLFSIFSLILKQPEWTRKT